MPTAFNTCYYLRGHLSQVAVNGLFCCYFCVSVVVQWFCVVAKSRIVHKYDVMYNIILCYNRLQIIVYTTTRLFIVRVLFIGPYAYIGGSFQTCLATINGGCAYNTAVVSQVFLSLARGRGVSFGVRCSPVVRKHGSPEDSLQND